MTKKQEILRLETLITSLGKDSYLGPWLETVKSEVERDINSDIFPSILPSETAKQCAKIRADADAYAASVKKLAEDKAAEIEKQALFQVNRIKNGAYDAVKIAMRALEG